jgi:PAS domain S-box-containing protein
MPPRLVPRQPATVALLDRLLRRIALIGTLAVAAMAVSPAVAADASPATHSAGHQTVVTTFDQLWQLGQSQPHSECRVHARMFVLCYYPDWHVLWVIWDKQVYYLDAGTRTLPLTPERWIDVDGVARTSNQTIDWARTTITPVDGLAAPRPARPAANATALATGPASEYAEIEGVVDDQIDVDTRHFRLNLIVGDALVTATVPIGAGDPTPILDGSRVRVRGLLSVKRDSSQSSSVFEFWCPSVTAVTVTGSLANDPRFAPPVTPIEHLDPRSAAEVHVRGTVFEQEPGRSVTLRDDTGQVTVLTPQVQPVKTGDAVEAVGVPVRNGIALNLRNGLFRRTSVVARENASAVLRLADQVRGLNPDAAAAGPPVRLTGVVTWVHPSGQFFFLQDASGGIQVSTPKTGAVQPVVGRGLVVRGTVRSGEFVPFVEAAELLGGDNLALPMPETISLDRAMTGSEYGRWVEMQGYVRHAVRVGEQLRVQVTESHGEFSALLPADDVPAAITGALVRLRGVCDAIANERRQLTGIQLLVPGSPYVRVVETAPVDPFATPVESIGNLLRYNPTTPLDHRVQVTGTVLLQRPGRLICVQDGVDTLTVLSAQIDALHPGDRIAVVGIPGRQAGRLVMRDAVYRRISTGPAPQPVSDARLNSPDLALDGRLVRVRGRLISEETTPAQTRLQVQHGNNLFVAHLELTDAEFDHLPAGSTVDVTGVYRVELDELQRPRGWSIELRSIHDVAVLARPSWWTAGRVLWVAGGLLGATLLMGAWSLMLSYKNSQLEHARDELELRVADRTRDLRLEVEQRRVSEQTLAHERMLLRTLIDNLPVHLYVKDRQGRFVIDNLPHARLLGAQTCDEVIGRTEADFWPASIAEDRRRVDEHLMSAGLERLHHEEQIQLAGEERWLATTEVPLRDESGTVTGLIAIAQDITARKEAEAEREALHRQVLETTRQAGMAEIATDVLHNVGNVLNSVNVSASLAAEIVAKSRSERLHVLINLFASHAADLPGFFAQDPRAQRVPEYLEALAGQFSAEQVELTRELNALRRNIDHIKEIVAMQQSYAKVAGVAEPLPIQEVIDDALRINADGLARHRVRVVRDQQMNAVITAERHKVLQILVNLISNAKYACDNTTEDERVMTITVQDDAERVSISVADNGVGIAAENLTRIFSHGFTTRKNGHGFGLHSGALAAREMGGTLRATSAGLGHGATFTLELPRAADPSRHPLPPHVALPA